MSKIATLLAAATVLVISQQADAKSSKTKSSDKQTSSVQSKAKAKQGGAVNNTVCPVSGQAIGSMGPGTQVTYKGYTVNLCCGGCRDRFNQNPDEYLKAALGSGRQ